MSITAQDINNLRQLTGAGMMDCKKALVEAQGDIDKAIEFLRKKGQKIAASRAGRDTTEGISFGKVNEESTYGVIIALSCETDFVAKNELFIQMGRSILDLALSERPSDLDELKQLTIDGKTIQEGITELIGKMGENITLSNFETLQGDAVVPYTHTGNKLSVLVAFEGAKGEQIIEAGRDVAMQIAALNPIAIDKDGITPEVIEKELEIAREQASQEAKNSVILENIAQGRLNKFFKENTLLNQVFVKDNSVTVGKYIEKLNSNLKIIQFKRVVVGSVQLN